MPFTDNKIHALRPRGSRYEIPEGGRTGLAVRVSIHGVKTFAFRYRFQGKQRRLALGRYPVVSLADARVKLADAMKELHEGRDPGAVQTDAPTVDNMIREYLDRHGKTLRPATLKEDRRILEKEILPHWKGRPARDISRRDIIRVLNGIEDRGKYIMRNTTASVISRLFLFALNAGLVAGTPATKLPRLKKVGLVKVGQPRARFLSKAEIASFWRNVDTIPVSRSVKAALKMALLTGQRRSEVALAARHELDGDLWTIPATRTKNGQEHVVPLPPLAVQVLRDSDPASKWLFASRGGTSLGAAALTVAVVRHRRTLGIGDATVHDLRRTFATWMGELGIQKELISALLNHSPKTVTGMVYDKSTLLDAKRRAMTTWSHWLEKVIAGDTVTENVVPLRRVR